MQHLGHHWKRLPASFRKPLVLIIGTLFILAAAATGWLPGPGGIPLFLIGVAILATEFAWAERLRDRILDKIRHIASLYRQHKITGTVVLILCAAAVVAGLYFSISRL
jgi:4-hydroxybenzoate polyprenyltransferase